MLLYNIIWSILLFLSVILRLSISTTDSSSWDVALIEQQISGAIGGEAFLVQPIISIFDKKEIDQRINLVGTIEAQLYTTNETKGEQLRIVQSDNCISVNVISTMVVDGEAAFHNLCLNKAGPNFRIQYTLRDEFDIILGTLVGNPFSVSVGIRYQIGVVVQPANITVGLPILNDPVVAVQDRGFNTIETVQNGTVRISLSDYPDSLEGTNVHNWNNNGTAIFHSLNFRKSGHFRLLFTTDLDLPGGNNCTSDLFQVHIGQATYLNIVQEPNNSEPPTGGKAFLHQPIVQVMDSGGNVLENDSSSRVVVVLDRNPKDGELRPQEEQVALVKEGVAHFKGLFINEAGVGYQFKYFLWQKEDGVNTFFNETNCMIPSSGTSFNVEVGPPETLSLLRKPSPMWAGNQPFVRQPRVALLDAGKNIIKRDSKTLLRANVVPSLSYNGEIIVDTSQDPVPTVVSVRYIDKIIQDSELLYSSGHHVDIIVEFSQDVFISSPPDKAISTNLTLPSLPMNVMNDNGENGQAYLLQNYLELPHRLFVFRFIVPDSCNHFPLNYASNSSLSPNDYAIVDGWDRDVSFNLPNANESTADLLSSKMIEVSSEAAVIIDVTTSVPSGSYGAGQHIYFEFLFSRQVFVQSTPYLPIHLNSSIVLIETLELGTSLSKSYFYIWYKNERSRSILWDAPSIDVQNNIESMQTVTGDVCVTRSTSQKSDGYRWVIRFNGVNDGLTSSNFDIERAAVLWDHEAMDIEISFLQTDEPLSNWSNSTDGESHMCVSSRKAIYDSGSGTKTLRFKYVVLHEDYTPRLTVMHSEIKVGATNATVSNSIHYGKSPSNVKASLDFNPSFLSGTHLAIDTLPPLIQDVQLHGDNIQENHTYRAGDVFYFNVSFTKPVVAKYDAEIKLNVGRLHNQNTAKLISGSGSSALLFRYTVQGEHETSSLNYVGPNALQISQDGWIRRLSSDHITDSNLTLPWPTSFQQFAIDGTIPTISQLRFDSNQSGHIFRAGEEISILAEFTSPVIISNGPPVLLLTVGFQSREAKYVSGNSSTILLFRYTIIVGDHFPALDFLCQKLCVSSAECMNEPTVSRSYIRQFSSNPILDADLRLPWSEGNISGRGILIQEAGGIHIDTGDALTRIVSITTTHESGMFGVGEIVLLNVEFTDDVFLRGSWPKLHFNTNSTAIYDSGSATNVITFRLLTSILDVTDRLDWELLASSNTPIVCDAVPSYLRPCKITNANGADANLSVLGPYNSTLSPLNASISIDNSDPRILSVYYQSMMSETCLRRPPSGACNYTAGDELIIVTKFNLPVTVRGPRPYLKMDINDHFHVESSNTVNAYYDMNLSNDTDVAFRYTVLPGHSTNGNHTMYICTLLDCSITLPLKSTIHRKSSNPHPTISANTSLFDIYEHGILNYNQTSIIIDATNQLRVVNVQAITPNGIFCPGDNILIKVSFNDFVNVSGVPQLMLDLNDGMFAIANYTNGDGEKDIVFQYDILPEHYTSHLDYIDIHSLVLGDEQVDNITQASDGAGLLIHADIKLPIQGKPGSLASNSEIVVDSRIPYVSSVQSIPGVGRFVTGDIISIQITFSRPITVSGDPSLLLETGLTDREAYFKSQFGNDSLVFDYEIQLGDRSEDLDYWVDEKLVRSSSSSFRLNGGSIMLQASSPMIDANIHLNPSFGVLEGSKDNVVNEGEVDFIDLKIGMKGFDYNIIFDAMPAEINLHLESTFFTSISESCEYQLVGDEADNSNGDMLGAGVSIFEDLIALGAPHKRNENPEIQVLTVFSETSVDEYEVQLISTKLDVNDAIRQTFQFKSSANPGETISGSFTLKHFSQGNYLFASSMILPSDSGPAQLQSILKDNLPNHVHVHASRQNNSECNCYNAWIWDVTISDAYDLYLTLETEGTGLLGNGAKISSPALLREVNVIKGNFTLINPFNGATTRNILYNETEESLKTILEEDLDIDVKSVMAANLNTYDIPELGRRWIITFSHYSGPYGTDIDVPNLEIKKSSLTGTNVFVWTQVAFEGKGRLGGSFGISLLESDFSNDIPFDASSELIKKTLESLDSINDVAVSGRRELQDITRHSGYSWTITFKSVNHKTPYGWLQDNRGNLPSMKIRSHLIGWKSNYGVEYEFGAGEMDTQAQWSPKSMGDNGTYSGEVAIYTRRNYSRQWFVEAFLKANDSDSHDDFGRSVSLHKSQIAIGAPSKEINGAEEIQTLTCNGNVTGGSFFIEFRGQRSDEISFDASINDVYHAVEGIYGYVTKVHSLPRIFLKKSEDWVNNSTGFCSADGNEISLTFQTPDGSGVSTETQSRGGDIEFINIDNSKLIGGYISVVEETKGTRSLSGNENYVLSGKQVGAVYIFYRYKTCEFCPYTWGEMKKVTPLDARDYPLDSSSQFGWNVELGSEILFVSAPGYDNSSGKVYIFDGQEFSFKYSLTSEVWEGASSYGDRFGYCIDADTDTGTLLVSSPGNRANRGAVYVFQKGVEGMGYLSSQAIYGPDLEPGDRFGSSISLSGNNAIICAPYKQDLIIQADGTARNIKKATGSCFIYTRVHVNDHFKLKEKLYPSSLKERDRFGYSSSISGDKILVGQLEEYNTPFRSQRIVQTVQTYCRDEACEEKLGSKFQLLWRNGITRTRLLAANTTGKQMKEALEADLETGTVRVSRSEYPDNDGGFTWSITFTSLGLYQTKSSSIPELSCDVTKMTGSDPACLVQVEHDVSLGKPIRSKVHLFIDRNDSWTEQALLFPATPQPQDLFGFSVDLDGDYAIVGAPNRETLQINSGAAMVYDTSFANFYFHLSESSIFEGESLRVQLSRTNAAKDQIIGIKSMDINANASLQDYVNELYEFRSGQLFPLEETAIDMLNRNQAFGRSQYYGSIENRSSWVNGMFDYRGINDYKRLDGELLIEGGELNSSVLFETTDDQVFENPDENVSLHILIPGMFASSLGNLKTDITINDDGDGVSANETWYHKFCGIKAGGQFGSSINVIDDNYMVVGAEHYTIEEDDGSIIEGAGIVYVFHKDQGHWSMVSVIMPPEEDRIHHSFFGQSTSISKPYGRQDISVLVSAPGRAKAYVFALKNSTSFTWEQQAVLTGFDNSQMMTSEHNFGGGSAVDISGDLAFIGSGKMEAVYVYRRLFDRVTGEAKWEQWSKLKSADFDYDLYGNGYTIRHVHQQLFGVALSSSKRRVLIGAPYSNYGNRGDVNIRETHNTDGTHNVGLGRGKAFVFYSQPCIQSVTLQYDTALSNGSFRLHIDTGPFQFSSSEIEHNSTLESIKTNLEASIPYVGEIDVHFENKILNGSNVQHESTWSITFQGIVSDDFPTLHATWYGNSCESCTPMIDSNLSSTSVDIVVNSIATLGAFSQEDELQAGSDVTNGERFGYSVALDGNQVAIGAIYSAAKTRSTWNFETGDLVGWAATGDAFQFNPTYGDNSRRRSVYEGFGDPFFTGDPQTSDMNGRYYIGTYEKHPGAKSDYTQSNETFREGSIQGDEPTGTLTSDPFIIKGGRISFLIGGGCNHLTEYMELLVDGFRVLRETGNCNERMNEKTWDVSLYMGRAAQIRIVDASAHEPWGHINVDEIQFSWDIGVGMCQENTRGQCENSGGTITHPDQSKEHYSGPVETPSSGAVYLFSRSCMNNTNCKWKEEQRIVPSDKRSGDLFGSSLAIDDKLGIAVIGSPHSRSHGIYMETPSVYPHNDLTGMHFPFDASLERLMRSASTMSPVGGNLNVVNFIESTRDTVDQLPLDLFNKKAGSIYIFARRDKVKATTEGSNLWQISEDMKVSPPDIFAGDVFSHSVGLSGTTVVAGAIGDDSCSGNDGGASYIFDISMLSVHFTQPEYVILEGSRDSVTITVRRDGPLDRIIAVGYATSDLSAIGVDKLKFRSCQNISLVERERCGDYEQTSGELIFNAGEDVAQFHVNIMNDICREMHIKYIQLNLHIPGAGVVHGENYRSQIRLDDDDWVSTDLDQVKDCSVEII